MQCHSIACNCTIISIATHNDLIWHVHIHTCTQMAGVAGAFVLNDRNRFRGFFRTLPSFELVGPSLAEIARKFDWTQMAIITQEESLFILVC